ncbi:MAG: hypothetical protein GF334_06290 [Candidatus Altiarchaeales archaeon]|nr:hypothetical protein [Candidatus Altiarchaeales archaeon]
MKGDDMRDKDYDGRLVYLTVHADRWFKEAHPSFNIPLSNRLAKVIKVFDWNTPEGKLLLSAREKTGKWGNFESKDFKFVLKVYHPDIIRGQKKGLTVEEVLPRCYPGSELLLFDVLPEWMISDLNKVEKDMLKIDKKPTKTRKKPQKRTKTAVKKTTKRKQKT